MKTQTITVEIKATVPVGDWCEQEEFEKDCEKLKLPDPDSYNAYLGVGQYCKFFKVKLKLKDGYALKCKKCLSACANGFQKGLDELSEGMKKEK